MDQRLPIDLSRASASCFPISSILTAIGGLGSRNLPPATAGMPTGIWPAGWRRRCDGRLWRTKRRASRPSRAGLENKAVESTAQRGVAWQMLGETEVGFIGEQLCGGTDFKCATRRPPNEGTGAERKNTEFLIPGEARRCHGLRALCA